MKRSSDVVLTFVFWISCLLIQPVLAQVTRADYDRAAS